MVDWNEIGKGDKACQNPPKLSKEDRFIWTWYQISITAFTIGFNLMAMLIGRIDMDEVSERIFLAKLDLIHQTMIRIQEKETKKEERNA